MTDYLLITKIKKNNMFDDFDSLFNDFFNERKDNSIDRLKKIIDSLNNPIDSEGDSFKEEDLGEPTSVIEYTENGYTFKKSIWELEHGSIVKVEMVSSDLDSGFRNNDVVLSLEEKLELAIKDERYEDAAKIRDEIKLKGKK